MQVLALQMDLVKLMFSFVCTLFNSEYVVFGWLMVKLRLAKLYAKTPVLNLKPWGKWFEIPRWKEMPKVRLSDFPQLLLRSEIF